ncbi:MAG: class I SAM-dependent methyltransferase [Clostridia bacterium]|nr:class I SAM-dependent methyltransferase [Clostridia bacterium]
MEFDKELKQDAKLNDVPISFDETMEFLINTINKYNCKDVLEIGTAIGFGSISMASFTNLDHIDTLEINEETSLKAKENIKARNLEDKITVFNIDAKKYLENCNKKYDLVYLDGPKGQYINYLPFIKKLLKNSKIIVADNIFFHGMVLGTVEVTAGCRSMIKGLHKFVDEITTSSDLESQILNIGDGVALIKVKL